MRVNEVAARGALLPERGVLEREGGAGPQHGPQEGEPGGDEGAHRDRSGSRRKACPGRPFGVFAEYGGLEPPRRRHHRIPNPPAYPWRRDVFRVAYWTGVRNGRLPTSAVVDIPSMADLDDEHEVR